MTELLSVKEVAARLGISVRSVYREMNAGTIRYAVVKGHRRVKATEVEAYIAAAFRAA